MRKMDRKILIVVIGLCLFVAGDAGFAFGQEEGARVSSSKETQRKGAVTYVFAPLPKDLADKLMALEREGTREASENYFKAADEEAAEWLLRFFREGPSFKHHSDKPLAVIALGMKDRTGYVVPLKEIFVTMEEKERVAIAYWFKPRGYVPAGAVEFLRAVIDDESPKVRGAVVQSLGSSQDPQRFDYLRAACEDPDATVRKSAVMVFGGSAAPGRLAVLIRFLKDPDKSIRIEAAKALGQLGDPQAVGPLVEVLEDRMSYGKNRNVGHEVGKALLKINSASAVPLLLESLRSYQKIFSDSDHEKLTEIYHVIVPLKDPMAWDYLLDSLKDEETIFQKNLKWILSAKIVSVVEQNEDMDKLAGILRAEKDEFKRIFVIRRLQVTDIFGKRFFLNTIGVLVPLLKDRSEAVRFEVLGGLAPVHNIDSSSSARLYGRVRRPSKDCLRELVSKVKDPLVRMSRNSRETIRNRVLAIKILKLIDGGMRTKMALLPLRFDGGEEISNAIQSEPPEYGSHISVFSKYLYGDDRLTKRLHDYITAK